MFAALSDATCQTIIRETVGEALTADELADRCDLSRSAVYRKTSRLVEGGLLERGTRIRPGERNVAEYRPAVDSIRVELSEERGIHLRFTPSSNDEGTTET